MNSVAASPDGRWFASASYDGTVQFWDAVTGAWQSSMAIPRIGVYGALSVAFSPDSRRVAVGYNDYNRIRVYTVK